MLLLMEEDVFELVLGGGFILIACNSIVATRVCRVALRQR